jgi:hypothetical protein
MKKYIASIILSTITFSVFGQCTGNDIKLYNNYDLLYINNDPIEDLRKPKAGTRAITVMGLIPVDLPEILDAGALNEDIELDNRLPERIFPNIRFYRSEKAVTTIGLVYAQTASNYRGDVLQPATSVPGTPESYTLKSKKRKIALRVANDKHFNSFRFRRFDLDPYWGASGSFGFAPQVLEENETYVGGDFNKRRETKRYMTFGLDAYFGCNIMFERFSFGLEIIALGADFQKNAGMSKIEESSSVLGVTVDREYYTSEDWEAQQGTQFSDLKMSDNQVSMYKGIRGVFCFYLY